MDLFASKKKKLGTTKQKFQGIFNVVLTFSLSIVGASIAYYLKFPLPWMVGPLFLLTFLSIAGMKLSFPSYSAEPIFALVGIYLGSSIAQGGVLFDFRWILTLIAMILFTLFATFSGYLYFRKVANYSKKESFLSSLPGALAYISVYIIDSNLPPAKIILSQSMRVLLVVGLAPFVYQWISGNDSNAINFLTATPIESAWIMDLVIAVLISVPTIWLCLKTKVPNAWFLGGMFASIVCYLTGITDQKLPTWILQFLLVLIGTMIGVRFAGTKFRQFLKYTFHGLNAAVILLIITYTVSWGVAFLLQTEPIKIFLAFAPGGVHEMAIIAFAYSIEPIFVTFHHILRIFVISFLIPIMIRKI